MCKSASGIYQNQIVLAVFVQISHQAINSTVGGNRNAAQRVDLFSIAKIKVSIFVLGMSVAIANEQVNPAVIVQIQAINQLDSSPGRDIDVGPPIFKMPL